MKTKDVVKYLGEVRSVAEQSAAYDPEHTEALTEAIKHLDTPSDRCLANEILIVWGVILGGAGTVCAICGAIYIFVGDFTAAWALLPWALLFSVFTLLSFAGVRK
ncbi:MAG: hypothetical protein LUD82_03560 [Clostridiales bacterium]|nr:hypothetical protein [Clostridiales bacterium]